MDSREFYEAVCEKLEEEYKWDHRPDFFFVLCDFTAGESVEQSAARFGGD